MLKGVSLGLDIEPMSLENTPGHLPGKRREEVAPKITY
jgi:hypothetical protein